MENFPVLIMTDGIIAANEKLIDDHMREEDNNVKQQRINEIDR